MGVESLELIELDTTEQLSILHYYCKHCEAEMGEELRGYCGSRLGGDDVRGYSRADCCVMCVQVKNELEGKTCPRGHKLP